MVKNEKQNKQKETIICSRCEVELEEIDAYFTYLDRKFKHKVSRCPECGQVHLDEELVKDKMARMEMSLEDK